MFWFGAVPPIFIIAFRWSLPETNAFQVMAAEREEREAQLIAETSHRRNSKDRIKDAGLRAWAKDAGVGLKMNWVLLCYMVVLMTGRTLSRHRRTRD